MQSQNSLITDSVVAGQFSFEFCVKTTTVAIAKIEQKSREIVSFLVRKNCCVHKDCEIMFQSRLMPDSEAMESDSKVSEENLKLGPAIRKIV